MSCTECYLRGKTWSGSDPKCAFHEGTFTRNNWNCATMNLLRDIVNYLGTTERRDGDAGSIGYIPFADIVAESCNYTYDGSGYIVMTWYKNRGETGNAVVMWDDNPTFPLTESIAREVIKQYPEVFGGYGLSS